MDSEPASTIPSHDRSQNAPRRPQDEHTRRLALLFMTLALATLAAGSILCGSVWLPNNLNHSVGPGTATYIGLILWPLVLALVLLFATLGLRAVRLTRYALVLVIASVMSWIVLYAIGSFPSAVVALFFITLNIGAMLVAWLFVIRKLIKPDVGCTRSG